MKKPRKTLSGEFAAGAESGKHPHPDNTRKAIASTVHKATEPLVRAYWAGYLCQLTTDNPDALRDL